MIKSYAKNVNVKSATTWDDVEEGDFIKLTEDLNNHVHVAFVFKSTESDNIFHLVSLTEKVCHWTFDKDEWYEANSNSRNLEILSGSYSIEV